MGLEDRKLPMDAAPNWIDDTYSERVFKSITCLLLFNFITEEESLKIMNNANNWFDKPERKD